MAIEAVVLDIGGVLELTPPTGWMQRWEERLELPSGALEARITPLTRPGDLGHATYEEITTAVAHDLSLDGAASATFWEDLWHEYLGTSNEELMAYVRALRPRYRVGLLSNSFVGAREREEGAYGFSSLCDTIVYSHEEGLEKPQPAFYAVACRRLGVDPAQVVFVDDHEICVTAAAALGMTAIRYESNQQTIAAIDQALGVE